MNKFHPHQYFIVLVSLIFLCSTGSAFAQSGLRSCGYNTLIPALFGADGKPASQTNPPKSATITSIAIVVITNTNKGDLGSICNDIQTQIWKTLAGKPETLPLAPPDFGGKIAVIPGWNPGGQTSWPAPKLGPMWRLSNDEPTDNNWHWSMGHIFPGHDIASSHGRGTIMVVVRTANAPITMTATGPQLSYSGAQLSYTETVIATVPAAALAIYDAGVPIF